MRVTTVDDSCRLFFRLFFDEFEFVDFSEKGYWARCFGKSFESSGGVQETSRVHLGRVLGDLGGVLGALGAILDRPLRQSIFGSFF